jgi:septum formation protein
MTSKESKSRLILASKSPRRRQLLEGIGLKFIVVPASIDESIEADEDVESVVLRLAEEKAQVVADAHEDSYVLAADTVVVLSQNDKEKEEEISGEEEEVAVRSAIFGKPRDSAEAKEMLYRLQGREHQVITGYCLNCKSDSFSASRIVETTVKMKPLSREEIEAYVATGEPLDKAGSYAIQGIGGAFVESLQGSYTNVVGLPVAQVISDLSQCGIWTSAALERVSAAKKS